MSVLSVVPLVRESRIHAVCCECLPLPWYLSAFLYSRFLRTFTITLERVRIEEEQCTCLGQKRLCVLRVESNRVAGCRPTEKDVLFFVVESLVK